MANKPVIAIDIDDTQFKSFYELFNKYKGEIGEMPEAWKGANEVLNAGMAAVVEQTHNINKNLHTAITAQQQFAKATHVSNKGMKSMAKYAKETYEHIFRMGKFVLKAGAWGGGLLAAGTFGFDKLAASVLKSAVSARSINTDTGRLRAFQTDYAQLAPANLPNSAYAAQRDMSKAGWLQVATGLQYGQAQQMDPVALSQLLVQRAHAYYQANKNNPTMLSEQSAMMQAFSAVGMNREAVTLAGNTPESKIIEAQRQMQADALRLRYTNAAINEMQKFWRALRIAGQNLETILGNRLSKLAGPIGKLITAVEEDAAKLLNGLLSKQNLDAAKDALDSFTKFLESGKAKTEVQNLVGDLKDFGGAVKDVITTIDEWLHPGKRQRRETTEFAERLTHTPQEVLKAKPLSPDVWGFLKDESRNRKVAADWTYPGSVNPRTLEKKYDLPEGSVNALTFTESTFDPTAVSPKGARGLMQLLPGTFSDMGGKDWTDPEQNQRAGAKYLDQMRQLSKKLAPKANELDQNMMAVAAYNWGPGNFQKFWKKEMAAGKGNGLAWMADTPAETQREMRTWFTQLPNRTQESLLEPYLRQIAQNTKPKPVKVQITTTTPVGARVAMQSNAAR